MHRFTILALTLLTLTSACVVDDAEDTDAPSTTAETTGDVDPRALAELEEAWLATLESLHDQWRRGDKEPRGCISGALGMSCASCSASLIPPKLHCWVSTPLGECSGYCDLAGLCGGGCR